jgi:phosphomannomutase/phosphoglucomutase
VDGGWGLVRASNTQPALVLRFEAPSSEGLARLREMVEGEVHRVRASLGA